MRLIRVTSVECYYKVKENVLLNERNWYVEHIYLFLCMVNLEATRFDPTCGSSSGRHKENESLNFCAC
jgi:hypothetical protein